MDAVYRIYNKYSSANVNIKEYFEKYSNELTDIEYNETTSKAEKKDILDIMEAQIEKDELQLLSAYCSVDNLTVPNEVPKIIQQRMPRATFEDSTCTDDVNLHTVHEAKQMCATDALHKYRLKYLSELFIKYEKAQKQDVLAAPGKDIIVYVRIYRPFEHAPVQSKRYNGTSASVDCVIGILGSQTLAQLRDKIQCVSDLSISTEVSKQPDAPLGPLAQDVYKSGFIYIDDTFYNDTRDPANIDYSGVIIEWSKTRNLGPFKTAPMEHTRMDSICTKFGFPWVYQHQGNCEHLIVISDARLLNTDDELSVSAYPRICRIKPRSTKYCMMCGQGAVHWITKQSDRIPHDPCFFCDSCFKSYNYIDGKKIGNFQAYVYPCYPDLLDKDKSVHNN